MIGTMMFKSRFRGVYKCGKRWKAQLQSQGVQFYLGTFDTEEEAAKAYDRKARDEKGEKGQTNFDDNGEETLNATILTDNIFVDEMSIGTGINANAIVPIEAPRSNKKVKTSPTTSASTSSSNGVAVAVAVPRNEAVFPVVPEVLFGPENSTIQVQYRLN